MRNINKFRGCLFGGAVGDALGYTVEFYDEPLIYQEFGQNGITEYDLIKGKALISDDTQMTLFTANGLLLGTTRGMTRGIMGSYDSYISKMYECWYRTQFEEYPVADSYKYSWLLDVPELFNRRAPGNTCLSAIHQGCNGTIENPINNSKGCGGVMRVAPIGLYFCDKKTSIEESDILGAEVSALTHGHELGYIPSATLVHIIRKIIEDESITLKAAVIDSITATEKLFSEAKYINDFSEIMNKAVMLSESDIDDLTAIHTLGEGWVAEETLAIAVYCALKYPNDFENAVITAVNHNGDSDSTGAVLGNILGAYLGYDAIPDRFKKNLELGDIILEMADDLYNDCQITEYTMDNNSLWKEKYIECNYGRKLND